MGDVSQIWVSLPHEGGNPEVSAGAAVVRLITAVKEGSWVPEAAGDEGISGGGGGWCEEPVGGEIVSFGCLGGALVGTRLPGERRCFPIGEGGGRRQERQRRTERKVGDAFSPFIWRLCIDLILKL